MIVEGLIGLSFVALLFEKALAEMVKPPPPEYDPYRLERFRAGEKPREP